MGGSVWQEESEIITKVATASKNLYPCIITEVIFIIKVSGSLFWFKYS
jgi:hypothetical protein